MPTKLNHLEDEISPYLLQHATNPVDWYPWTPKALDKAAKEDKLLVISIGYAACHWCHVMEHECFEDQEVASVMNADFVSVKVDREERPDIDQVYMDAAFIISGRGGWPLNVIALPNGDPVYAGTYFPKQEWLYVLNTLATAYKTNKEGTLRDAAIIRKELSKTEITGYGPTQTEFPDPDDLFLKWKKILDYSNGGTKGAPKFPMPVNLEYLLFYGVKRGNPEALRSVEGTLDKMAAGGIYDHLGGGFSRYSTDARWHVPHFEKMLYDNAQLISIYSKAYKQFLYPRYREVVYDSLAFIQRELTAPEGLCYSSIDADSEGKEGSYYVWKASEIRDLLKEKSPLIQEYYSVSEEGNWEKGNNVLFRQLTHEEQDPMFRESSQLLFEARNKRVHPALDYKILASWNALMITALVDASLAFSDAALLQKAIHAANLLFETFIKEDGRMIHSGRKGSSEVNGFLEDYALLIKAFTDLYQASFDPAWLHRAEKLTEYVFAHFLSAEGPLFRFTSDLDRKLIIRKTETGDNVIPSSNSVMAMNLLVLGHLLGKDAWLEKAKMMVRLMTLQINDSPYHHGLWAYVSMNLLHSPYEISIVGPGWKELLEKFCTHYFPGIILSGGEAGEDPEILKGKTVKDKTLVYVCRDRTCAAPLSSLDEVMELLKK